MNALKMIRLRGLITSPKLATSTHIPKAGAKGDVKWPLRNNILKTEGIIPPPEPYVRPRDRVKWKPENHEPKSENHYGTLNFTVQGYDMVVVEKYSQCIHKDMINNNIEIKEVYALPPEYKRVMHIGTSYTISPDMMDTEAELTKYTRVIQVTGMPSTTLPILLQFFVRDIPAGIDLTVHEFTEADFLTRYKENKDLAEAKQELQRIRDLR